MEDLIKCPMCFGSVPRGAVVCRGCKARIEYGIPSWIALGLLIVSAMFGFWSGAALVWWVGLIGAIVLFVLGSVVLQHAFRNRIVFRLRY